MYCGLKLGQITQNIDDKICFKTHSFGSPVFKDHKYRLISLTHAYYIIFFFSLFAAF